MQLFKHSKAFRGARGHEEVFINWVAMRIKFFELGALSM